MSNALLITADSLRADHVGCYGYHRDTTPFLDEWAAKGVTFTQAFAHACNTRPSFPSIMTSSYPTMYGGYELLSEERTLVSEVFSNAGFRTGGFHSNAYLNPEFGYSRGFDDFFDSMSVPSVASRIKQLVRAQLDENGRLYNFLASAFDTAERQAGLHIGSPYVSATEITDRAIEWIENGRERNQFLWVHYMDVHHPYHPPEKHQLVFRDQPIPEREAIRLRRKFMQDPQDVTEQELYDIIDLYDGEIHYMDSEVSRLIQTVENAWDDCVIAFTSDHGEEFGEHGEFSHRPKFYDELIHVPLFLNGGNHSGTVDELVGLVDLAPTLLGAVEISAPDTYFGHDLNESLDGEPWPRDSVLADWKDGKTDEHRFMYRDEEWKYIRRESGEEVYDLRTDPGETENMVNAAPTILEHGREVIDTHHEAIRSTDVDTTDVEMGTEVKQRLRNLGYQE